MSLPFDFCLQNSCLDFRFLKFINKKKREKLMYNNLKCEQKVRNEIDRCTLDNS